MEIEEESTQEEEEIETTIMSMMAVEYKEVRETKVSKYISTTEEKEEEET